MARVPDTARTRQLAQQLIWPSQALLDSSSQQRVREARVGLPGGAIDHRPRRVGHGKPFAPHDVVGPEPPALVHPQEVQRRHR
jgi:hypothetical protein